MSVLKRNEKVVLVFGVEEVAKEKKRVCQFKKKQRGDVRLKKEREENESG